MPYIVHLEGKCCSCGELTRHREGKQHVCKKHLRTLEEFNANEEGTYPLCPECDRAMYKNILRDGTVGYTCALGLDIWVPNKDGKYYRIDLIRDPRI